MGYDIFMKPVQPREGEVSNIKANVTVYMDGGISVPGFKVMEGTRQDTGEKFLFVSAPSVKNSKGEYNDIAFFTGDTKKEIDDAIISKYNNLTIVPKISEVRVTPIEVENGNTKALASVAFENGLRLGGIRVYEGVNGEGKDFTSISFPQRNSSREGEEANYVNRYNVGKETYDAVRSAVIDEYNKVMSLKAPSRGGR